MIEVSPDIVIVFNDNDFDTVKRTFMACGRVAGASARDDKDIEDVTNFKVMKYPAVVVSEDSESWSMREMTVHCVNDRLLYNGLESME